MKKYRTMKKRKANKIQTVCNKTRAHFDLEVSATNTRETIYRNISGYVRRNCKERNVSPLRVFTILGLRNFMTD